MEETASVQLLERMHDCSGSTNCFHGVVLEFSKLLCTKFYFRYSLLVTHYISNIWLNLEEKNKTNKFRLSNYC